MISTQKPSQLAQEFETAPARLTVDLGALVENWRHLTRLSGKAETAAVVKADAYGLGAAPVAQSLAKAGCRTFFVATPEEGARLRPVVGDCKIFVLSGLWRGHEETIFSHGLIPVLASTEQVAFFHAFGTAHPFALYVDTGMNRLGLDVQQAKDFAGSSSDKPVLVMSHLACSDDPDHAMNREQLESFQTVAAAFAGVESSLASSGGIFLGPDYHFDLTRPGIALYGGAALNGAPSPMRQVVTAEARILQIRDVNPGDCISYGASHRFERHGRIAIAGAGYADGWQRALSGSGIPLRAAGSPGAFGLVAGHRVPVVGRVTMDLTTFDISALPDKAVRTGDYVELFGNGIRLDDTAAAAGTISYELLTSLGARYARRYI